MTSQTLSFVFLFTHIPTHKWVMSSLKVRAASNSSGISPAPDTVPEIGTLWISRRMDGWMDNGTINGWVNVGWVNGYMGEQMVG